MTDAVTNTAANAVLGIIGGSGIYDLPGLEERPRRGDRKPVGGTIGGAAPRHHRWAADRVSVAARQGPPAVAFRHQLPRQYRCAQARRRDRSDFTVGLRFLQGGTPARHLRSGRSVRRSHLQAREFVLRQRLRGACVDGASGLAATAHPSGRGGRSGRHPVRARRHLSLHGRAAILDASPRVRPTRRWAIR